MATAATLLLAPVASAGASDATSTTGVSAAAVGEVNSKGGFKDCRGARKIRVHVAYALPGLPTDAKVIAKIYSSPSRSSDKDVNRTFTGQTDHSDLWIVSKLGEGYWRVSSSPGNYIVASDTYARCS